MWTCHRYVNNFFRQIISPGHLGTLFAKITRRSFPIFTSHHVISYAILTPSSSNSSFLFPLLPPLPLKKSYRDLISSAILRRMPVSWLTQPSHRYQSWDLKINATSIAISSATHPDLDWYHAEAHCQNKEPSFASRSASSCLRGHECSDGRRPPCAFPIPSRDPNTRADRWSWKANLQPTELPPKVYNWRSNFDSICHPVGPLPSCDGCLVFPPPSLLSPRRSRDLQRCSLPKCQSSWEYYFREWHSFEIESDRGQRGEGELKFPSLREIEILLFLWPLQGK